MSRRSPLKLVLGIVVIAVVILGAGVWWFLIRDDAPPEASLPERETTDDVEAGDATIEGSWAVAIGDETFAGFRITEQFPGIDNTAVVRSPAVDGTMTVESTSITAADITVDLTEMESQDSVPPGVPGIENRVDQMRGDGLETDTFPTATFVLAEPIDLGGTPELGETVSVVAVGDLTIHGVTNTVEIPLEARWNGSVIDVTGSLEVALADYGMTPPERQFVTVDDTGTMEFQLTFDPA